MDETKGAVNTGKGFRTKSLPDVPDGDSGCRTPAGRVPDVPIGLPVEADLTLDFLAAVFG